VNRDTLQKKLCQLLKQVAPDSEPEKLQKNDSIREVLGLDSFDALQFIVALDEHLGVDIPEKDYNQTTSLALLLDYLEKRLNQQ
jgi:acyl carrier protein